MHGLVLSLSKKVAPANINRDMMSDWFASILLKAENFCVHRKPPGKTTSDLQLVVYGKEALTLKWQAFQTISGQEKETATQELKMYRWMLQPAYQLELDTFIRDSIIAARGKVLARDMSIADAPSTKGEEY